MPRNTTTTSDDRGTIKRVEKSLSEQLHVEQTAPGLYDVHRWSDMADPLDDEDDPDDYADGAKVCTVDLVDGGGTCHDAQHRDGVCKHYLRAMLVEGTSGVAMALSGVMTDDDGREQPPTPDRGSPRTDGGRTIGGDLEGEPEFVPADAFETERAAESECDRQELPDGFQTVADLRGS